MATRVILNVSVTEAENGYTLTVNALGASKQFIAKDFSEAKKFLGDFASALTEPPSK